MPEETKVEASPKKPGIIPVAREDEVILRLIKIKESKGGIILPEARDHDQRFGKVVSVGPGGFNPALGTYFPSGLKVGDVVLLGRNKGVPFWLSGVMLVYISMHEIPVVLKLEGNLDDPISFVDEKDLEPIERVAAKDDETPITPEKKPRLVVD